MKFLRNLFAIENPTRTCLIWGCLILLVLTADALMQGNRLRTDGPVIAVAAPQTMTIRFGEERRQVRLARGEQVRLLGIRRYTYQQEYLVETESGDRGWLQADLLPVRQIIVKGEHEGDTVRLTGQKHLSPDNPYVSGYFARLADGTEIETRAECFVPDIEGWRRYVLDGNLLTAVAGKRKLRAMQGKGLEELERRLGPAFQIHRTKEGTSQAQFLVRAFDPEDGKFYLPVFTFDAGGKAAAVDFVYESDRSDRLLRILPGASAIFDFPLTSRLVRTGVYTFDAQGGEIRGVKLALMYAAALAVLLAGLIWLFCTASLPVLLMGWLIRYPRVFAPMSDRALKWTITAVAVLSFYYWAVALLGWGMFWPFLAILFLTGRYFRSLATCMLCRQPHVRCPQCRHLETIAFDREEFVKSEYRTGAEIKTGKLLGTSYSWKQTWDEVTYLHRNQEGRSWTTKRKENIRNHKMEHRTYEMIDYEVTYRIDHFRDHYRCGRCDFRELLDATKWTETDRQKRGSHTSTHTHEV